MRIYGILSLLSVRPNILSLTTALYFSVVRFVVLPGTSPVVYIRTRLCQEYTTPRKFDKLRRSCRRTGMTFCGVENLKNILSCKFLKKHHLFFRSERKMFL